jgi:hypothetical protein
LEKKNLQPTKVGSQPQEKRLVRSRSVQEKNRESLLREQKNGAPEKAMMQAVLAKKDPIKNHPHPDTVRKTTVLVKTEMGLQSVGIKKPEAQAFGIMILHQAKKDHTESQPDQASETAMIVRLAIKEKEQTKEDIKNREVQGLEIMIRNQARKGRTENQPIQTQETAMIVRLAIKGKEQTKEGIKNREVRGSEIMTLNQARKGRTENQPTQIQETAIAVMEIGASVRSTKRVKREEDHMVAAEETKAPEIMKQKKDLQEQIETHVFQTIINQDLKKDLEKEEAKERHQEVVVRTW